MQKIQSSLGQMVWDIAVNGVCLSGEDIGFIKSFNPQIYHNDLTSKLWAFDAKLPSGRWLENMEFNNEITSCKAEVYDG